jgi:aminoglycoside phosphotransferase (APT) family kinase protein
VPEVVSADVLDGRPVLLLTWLEGVPAREALLAAPAGAAAIGERLGETLGRINRVTAPNGLAPAGEWIERGGPALAPLRDRLQRVPNAARLIHLDFHPLNVLMASGEVIGVIDWTNTLSGPPHMDLARSRAILRVAATVMREQPGFAEVVGAGEAGLVAGHWRVAGPDPHPALSEAWGLAMTIEDIAGHVGKPGSGVTPALLDAFRQERNTLIETVLEGGEP